MARRVITEFVDDIDGKTGAGVQTHTFALDGVHYEIDLGEDTFQTLLDRLGPYFGAARKIGSRSHASGKRPRAAALGPNPADVREWAKKHGIDVNARGRVPNDVIQQYQTEN
ncbi:hypothetical protein B4N89_46000 [Embleya scabrispora]|uniref:Lsr2 family protein n=1 Tax=Embleya scabrispora TaxID=159449 RepID=A0A1T3NJ14_9ACTN|nr:Lsr2 family protein [Embleya scabrispora]OPC76829.1 hypothetical protein B4N89_46000 [Embleya scabrispora]